MLAAVEVEAEVLLEHQVPEVAVAVEMVHIGVELILQMVAQILVVVEVELGVVFNLVALIFLLVDQV
jgi:hypothetical protein